LSLLCIAILVSPLLMVAAFALRDRAVERRDQRIHAKCERLIELFEGVAGEVVSLNRVYLQASDGTAYPYDTGLADRSLRVGEARDTDQARGIDFSCAWK